MSSSSRSSGSSGSSSGSRVGVRSKTESLLELLGRSVDGTFAVLTSVEEGSIVLDGRLEVSSSSDEVLEMHGLVSDRLVNDRSFVSFLLDRNDSVSTVVFVGVALNDGLDEVVNVVRGVGVNLFSLVDDGLLGRTFATLISVSVQRCEHVLVLIGSNVTFLDFGFGVNLLVVFFGTVLSVENRLNVVLNMVNVTVNLALTLNFLNFVTLVSFVSDRSQVLVVVNGSLRVVLVQETVLSRLLVVVSRGVSVLLDLVADRLVSSVSSRSSSRRGRSGRRSYTS